MPTSSYYLKSISESLLLYFKKWQKRKKETSRMPKSPEQIVILAKSNFHMSFSAIFRAKDTYDSKKRNIQQLGFFKLQVK